MAIYREAAASDPQMAATMHQVLASREREIRKLVEALAPALSAGPHGRRRRSTSSLALTLPEVYATLVAERGWSARRYEEWLGDGARPAQLLSAPGA